MGRINDDTDRAVEIFFAVPNTRRTDQLLRVATFYVGLTFFKITKPGEKFIINQLTRVLQKGVASTG